MPATSWEQQYQNRRTPFWKWLLILLLIVIVAGIIIQEL
jgi:hypothetical protein